MGDGIYNEDKIYQTAMVLRDNRIIYVKRKIFKRRLPITIKKTLIVRDKVFVR